MKQGKSLLLFPLLMAMSLLTRIPVTRYLPHQWNSNTLGLSALWYPIVGVFIAGLLCALLFFLPAATSPWMMSILVVIVWVLITGALHLDGLADCIDAIYAGHSIPATNINDNKVNGQIDSEIENEIDSKVDSKADSQTNSQKSNPRKEKMLTVLKDPASGAMAVVSLVLVLLLKTILIASLLFIAAEKIAVVLLVSLMAARTMALLFIVTTPYAGSSGLGKTLALCTPKHIAFMVSAVMTGIMLLLLSINAVVLIIFSLFVLFILWRHFWLRTLGGFVGDAIGALIEISEVLMLMFFYFLFLSVY